MRSEVSVSHVKRQYIAFLRSSCTFSYIFMKIVSKSKEYLKEKMMGGTTVMTNDGIDFEREDGEYLLPTADAKRLSSSDVNKDEKFTSTDSAKDVDEEFTEYYTIFNILNMIGYICHSRKKRNSDIYVMLVLLASYVWLGHQPATTQHQPPSQRTQRYYYQYRNYSFVAYNIFMLWTWISRLPHAANHKNMLGIVTLILLPQQIQRCYYGNTSYTQNQTKATLNVVRIVTSLMYFFAGFHKLNYDFLFEPTVTCAYNKVDYYLRLFGYNSGSDYGLPTWLIYVVPPMVVVIETIPALLLLVNNHKIQAICVGNFLLFHLTVMPLGFVDFATIAQSLLILFVPSQILTKATELPMDYYFYMAKIFVFFETLSKVHWCLRNYKRPPFFESEVGLVLMSYGIIWMSIYCHGGWLSSSSRCSQINTNTPSSSSEMERTSLQSVSLATTRGVKIWFPKSIWSVSGISLFVVFAMSPYLGLRTAGCLTMFSNLRTEGQTSNHLLLRNNPFKFFNYQEDHIYIVDIDERWDSGIFDKIQFDFDDTVQRSVFNREIRKYCNAITGGGEKYANIYAHIEHFGVEYVTVDLCHDREWEKYRRLRPFWERKLLTFRRIELGDDGPTKCSW